MIELSLDTYLPYRLSVASNKVSALIAKAYEARFGLTVPQWRVLLILSEGVAHSQKQLIERTAMDKVTISRAVSLLVARGLVVRTSLASDRRVDVLLLAKAGEQIVHDVVPVALAFEKSLLAALPPDSAQLLDGLLRMLEEGAAALSSVQDRAAIT
jgi:DNA-binding MarR family transcriptional regulator